MTRWADVAAPWRAALELAWCAYAAGTIPVGAVVTDTSGRAVVEGRNAVYRPGDDAPLAGSRIAHAELAALGGLRSEDDHADKALYATLEPCLLCAGAAVMTAVGRVHFAGIDPYGGATSLPPDPNAHMRREGTAFHGPLDDDVGLFRCGDPRRLLHSLQARRPRRGGLREARARGRGGRPYARPAAAPRDGRGGDAVAAAFEAALPSLQ
jgi:tRNA(Arg) A34 adenosine deaminase TadA